MRSIPGAALAIGLVLAACNEGAYVDHAVAVSTPEDTGPAHNGGRQRAPIVLMHGMAGFDAIGPAEYFYGVADALRADGYEVLETVVDPFQSVTVRAGDAREQILAFLDETGATRVHLVGHSQGGLDARFAVSTLGLGDRVATVTTISTPHRGTPLADIATGALPGDAAAALAALSSALLGAATGTEADLGAQLVELGRAHCEGSFNPANPDDPRVEYYSVAGVTQPWLTVNVFETDVVDPLFLAAYWMNASIDGDNDGLVSVYSARWGELLGTVPADHLDEMGWFPELPQPAFDHLAFYRRLAAWLNDEGPRPL